MSEVAMAIFFGLIYVYLVVKYYWTAGVLFELF